MQQQKMDTIFDFISDQYLWTGVEPHEFMMAVDFILRKVLSSPNNRIEYFDFMDLWDKPPFAELPTMCWRAFDCAIHFLRDNEVIDAYEDEGTSFITLPRGPP